MISAASSIPLQTPAQSTRSALRDDGLIFGGMIDAVLVAGGSPYEFDGAIPRDIARSIWTWMRRDFGGGHLGPPAPGEVIDAGEVEAALPDMLVGVKAALAEAALSSQGEQRLAVHIGGEQVLQLVPKVLVALRARSLLAKAAAFGRAANAISDEHALGVALQSMPLKDQAVAAMLMHAAVGEVANPARVVGAIVRVAGSNSELAIERGGLGVVVEALLSHAQDQIHRLRANGPFADMDLVCRAVERYHRLNRAVAVYLELGRNGRWATILAALTKRVSERLEPQLRNVPVDLNLAMRRSRDGADRVDQDRLLAALNGVFLLATLRDCRDSLAINASFEQAWTQVGEMLEFHLNRNIDILRQKPDAVALERLDAGIRMAEQRFSPDYAEVLRRARDAAERRPPAAH